MNINRGPLRFKVAARRGRHDQYHGGSFVYNAPRDPEPLFTRVNDNHYVPATPSVIVDNALAIANQGMKPGTAMTAPAATREFLRVRLAPLDYEVFATLFLDNRHRLLEYRELFRGTVDGASVHPREVVKEALQLNAAAVIFAHNHPSGVSEASQADELITRRLRDALALIDIRVLDHLIVGSGSMISFAEKGLL